MASSELNRFEGIKSGQQNDSTSASSPEPALGEGFKEPLPTPATGLDENPVDTATQKAEDGIKPTIKRLFGFGKKDDTKDKSFNDNKKHHPTTLSSAHPYQSQSPPLHSGALSQASPRLVSPAGSQIFERDVQETAAVIPASPAIPAHIQTENHIPAVLDASSEAITDKGLDPDSVEIITHASHLPAASVVGGDGMTTCYYEGQDASPQKGEGEAQSYGALDNADIRRLSFISFADVVHSEQAEHLATSQTLGQSQSKIHHAGLITLAQGQRSPSPIGSRGSSSPGASVSAVEMSPARRPLGSPNLQSLSPDKNPGELTIETMSQALRKTRSGDLGGRSAPMSPAVDEGKKFP